MGWMDQQLYIEEFTAEMKRRKEAADRDGGSSSGTGTADLVEGSGDPFADAGFNVIG